MLEGTSSEQRLLVDRRDGLVVGFAKELIACIVKRLKGQKMKILQTMAFFDPLWGIKMPSWVYPSNSKLSYIKSGERQVLESVKEWGTGLVSC